GFSTRQGPHQLAQKSIKTYFPLKEDKLTASLLTSFSVKSGASAPITVTMADVMAASVILPYLDCCTSSERDAYKSFNLSGGIERITFIKTNTLARELG